MRYVTAEEMRRLDREAIETRGISAVTLMENAGRALADEAAKLCVKSGTALVFSGYGNNGGDGFVAARHLSERGFGVRVYLVGRDRPMSPEARTHYESMTKKSVKVGRIERSDDIDKALAFNGKADVVIDAIFGIGARGALDQFYIKAIEKINSLGLPIISADIPSGLDADTGTPLPVAVKAAKTVTFGYPKAGFNDPRAFEYTGEVVVADIGLGG
jgi:NAD(P)H-hydrate epimerase